MSRMHSALASAVALAAAALAGCGESSASRTAAQAQEVTRATSADFGEHVVHYNAQSTIMLPPDVARAFGIRRSGNRAMLNVTVLKRSEAGVGTAVTAKVEVQATNLLGQQKDVRMRELREGEAIYYVGELGIANEEIVNFEISVRPEALDRPHEIRFRQQFYTN